MPRVYYTEPLPDRLERCSIPEPNSGCTLWFGPTDTKGYGRIAVKGIRKFAHRLSYEMAYGTIPDGGFILHKCDTPACINPSHLRVGTQLDNMRDMMSRNRHRASGGERNGQARLTCEQVRQIRAATGLHKDIARTFGVHQSQVTRIKNGKRWRVLAEMPLA